MPFQTRCLFPASMDIEAEKEALLREMTPEAYDRRRQALEALGAWLRQLRGDA